MKPSPSPRDNPLTTLAAASHLGLPRFTILAIKRALGITRRYVFVSEIKNFLRNNPGWRPTDANRKAPQQPQVAVEPIPAAPPVIAAPSDMTVPTPPLAGNASERKSFARMCRRVRKQNKVGVKDLASKTGLSASCIYKMERTGDVSITVVKQLVPLICKNDVESRNLIAQWMRETVGNVYNEIRIESLDKDDVLESQMGQIKSIVCSLIPEQRAQIITSLSDIKILGLLCNLSASGASNPANSV